MDDLIDRYDFERRLNGKTPAQCPYFLEKQILNELVRLFFPKEIPTTGHLLGEKNDGILSRALDIIDRKLFLTLTLDELARDLDVGVSLVQKTFQKELGISPMALIADMRLEHAASFLERGDWTPSELAHICGYSELSAFSRAFKRKFGVSPKAFAAKR